jgi:putative addiction module component (TIGR02574 family)
MGNQQLNIIFNLSIEEKLLIVQKLWDNIASEQKKLEVPVEHKMLLMQRIKKIESGKTSFKNWEDIKNKYLT